MDLLTMFLKGGLIMWPILLCSIAGLTIIIDRFFAIKKVKQTSTPFLIKVKNLIRKKDIHGAINICSNERIPAANIVRRGLQKYKLGHQRVKETIENAGRQEISKLEKGLTALATVAGVAPMLGFLGTVTGMVSAFATIQNLQGAANPSDLAGGIWEALITTVFGLIVGIIALTFYNYFVASVTKLVLDLESLSIEIIDSLEEVLSGKEIIREDE